MKKVQTHIKIDTTPALVIKAFTDSKMLRQWWGVDKCIIETVAGGLYTLAWQVKEASIGYVSTGIITRYIPDQELIVDNLVYLNPGKDFLGPMKLTVRAAVNDGLTDVYLCQEGYQSGKDWEWYYDAVKDAWPEVMIVLKNYLENSTTTAKA